MGDRLITNVCFLSSVPFPLRISAPPDVLLLTCNAPTDSNQTGRALVSFVSEFCLPAAVPFHDFTVSSASICKTVLTRHWVANDSCGNVARAVQIIEIEDRTSPTVVSPQNVSASCGSYEDVTHVGSPSTADDCPGEVSTWYSDELNGCSVTRTWHARDKCGNTMSSGVQTIQLLPGPLDFQLPGDVRAKCGESLDPAVTGVPLVREVRLCSWNTTAATAVRHADISREERNCHIIIGRRWSVTDVCGSSAAGVQTITVLYKEPVIQVPPDLAVTCRMATDLSATREANITSSCRSTVVSHSDRLNGSVLLRSWTLEDGCSRVAAPLQQSITLKEDPPVLLVPPNVTIACHESSHPNRTGWARLERDLDSTCFELGGTATTVRYTDRAAGGTCPGFIVRQWRASTFLGHSVEADQWITLG